MAHKHKYEVESIGAGAFALVELCPLAPKRKDGWKNRVANFTAPSKTAAEADAEKLIAGRAGVCAWSKDGKA